MQTQPIDQLTQPLVLLAEDDPDQSDMLREALQEQGFAVDTAFSGDVARRKLDGHNYDLVILDIRMPGLDGTQVLKAYRTDAKHHNVPVIIVSAFATGIDIEKYKHDGATAAFSKPYDLNLLLNTSANLIAIKRGRNGR